MAIGPNVRVRDGAAYRGRRAKGQGHANGRRKGWGDRAGAAVPSPSRTGGASQGLAFWAAAATALSTTRGTIAFSSASMFS